MILAVLATLLSENLYKTVLRKFFIIVLFHFRRGPPRVAPKSA